MRAVSEQPVAVAINGNITNFIKHKRSDGIFRGPCDGPINHEVVAVGYGTTSGGINYWLFRNSWGRGWAENGYVRMERGETTRREGSVNPSIPVCAVPDRASSC